TGQKRERQVCSRDLRSDSRDDWQASGFHQGVPCDVQMGWLRNRPIDVLCQCKQGGDDRRFRIHRGEGQRPDTTFFPTLRGFQECRLEPRYGQELEAAPSRHEDHACRGSPDILRGSEGKVVWRPRQGTIMATSDSEERPRLLLLLIFAAVGGLLLFNSIR